MLRRLLQRPDREETPDDHHSRPATAGLRRPRGRVHQGVSSPGQRDEPGARPGRLRPQAARPGPDPRVPAEWLRLLRRHAHKDARAAGEIDERLTALPVWREAPFFTARERAVLAFTESVTRMAVTHVPHEDYEAVAAELTPREIAALVCLIVTINAWNAIGVSTRTWQPGTYQPDQTEP
jgi:hypothetical protein